jgi:peptidyl-prolyl cis-trans isomerase SurA
MTQRLFRNLAAFVFVPLLLVGSASAQTRPAAPESPYGGNTVEDIVARVNDQIITSSDYDRAMKELDEEMRQHGATMQQISEAHNDLLRNLIDQQLLLSKGKELGITGETELINRLNEIRKQNNLETLEDLEKAAKEQGVSFEDFKANIRNNIISQEVLRDQVGRKVQFTPGELQRYYDAHAQEYARPESVTLSEILVAVAPSPLTPTMPGSTPGDDPAALAAAKAKADDIEAKLHAGGDFAQLARSFSDGTTAAEGGDLGQFQRGKMAKVLEDATFSLKAGDITEPIRTRQGYIIFKVTQHAPGGVPPLKDVEAQVEDAFYSARMEPAIREFQTTMREQAYIDYDTKRFVDTGASPKETKPVYSAYTPPTPKKKKKIERTRFRESTRTFRQKSGSAPAPPPEATATKKNASLTSQKPGKKEKIRYGKAPVKTLPAAAAPAKPEDAGAVEQASANEPVNPLETKPKPTEKTRFSQRATQPKQPKVQGPKPDKFAPAAPDAAEVADRQTQAAPLGLAGDTASKKKKKKTTETEKTRLSAKSKEANAKPAPEMTPAPQVPGAPAPQIPPQAPAPALPPAPAPQK